MKSDCPPAITIRNAQRTVLIAMRELERFAELAGKLVWQSKRPKSDIVSLTEIAVLIVSDRRMAALHKQFCGIPGATDVITFQHGEIVLSADKAANEARKFHTSTMAELQLYLLHGLLHLAGFDDATPSKQKEMFQMQDKLIKSILAAAM